MVKKLGCKLFWTVNGNILVRKTTTSASIVIKSEKQLSDSVTLYFFKLCMDFDYFVSLVTNVTF